MVPPNQYAGPFEGGPPNPKIVEKNLKDSLAQLNEPSGGAPGLARFYGDRGTIFLGLFKVAQLLDDRANYAERATADFAKAIELDQTDWQAYEHRAELLRLVDFFGYFDNVESDYFETIRLTKMFCASSSDLCVKQPELRMLNDQKVHELILAVSALHWKRAKALSSDASLREEVRRLYKEYSAYSEWNDFDLALKYSVNEVKTASEVWVPVNYALDKGDAAYLAANYSVSIDAYNLAKEVWEKNASIFCRSQPTLCDSENQHAEDTFNNRLARLSVKMGKWDAALSYVNRFLSKINNTSCPTPFLFRAKIYRHLGRTELALSDEEKASKLPISPTTSCHGLDQDWR